MTTIFLRIWSEYACFTRPEMKVERVSYDVMTPSAARAVLETIYWKPTIRWVIDKIHVLKPIRFTNIRRNELSNKISVRNISTSMKENNYFGTFIEDERQQRAATVLKDVEYVIEAHFLILSIQELQQKGFDPKNFSLEENYERKHLGIFNRRAEQGQCYKRPFLGCREFSAHFELIKDKNIIPKSQVPDKDLGWMLYDIDFEHDKIPMFFHAQLTHGIVYIPAPDSKEVKT